MQHGVMILLVVQRPLWEYGHGPVCEIGRLPTLKPSGANPITGGLLNGGPGIGTAANSRGPGIFISHGGLLISMERRGGMDGGGGTGSHQTIFGLASGHTSEILAQAPSTKDRGHVAICSMAPA